MALSRTWYSNTNQACTDTANVGANLLWYLKAFLKGTVGTADGRGLWTVVGSSDGATAGMDSVDRWTNTYDLSKLVFADSSTARSWIVLQSPGALGMYLCLDFSGGADAGGGNCMRAFASSTAFTGGSTSALPTATKQFQVHCTSSDRQQMADGTVNPHKFHYTADASGNFWFMSSRNGTGMAHYLLGLQKVTEQHTGDVGSVFSLIAFKTTARGAAEFDGDGLWAQSAGSTSGRIGGRNISDSASLTGNMGITWPWTITNGTFNGSWTAANPADGKWDVMPVYLVNPAAGGGVRGRLPDCGIAFGASNAANGMAVGSSTPISGAVEQVVCGNLLLPFAANVTF